MPAEGRENHLLKKGNSDAFFREKYLTKNNRLFPYTKSFLNHEMLRGCKKSGVKKIRVHDLRHSHASLLIEMGCQPLLIADRLGHEKIQTTLNTYSHLYPNKQAEVAAQLENVMNGTTVPNGSQIAGVANL